MHKWRWEDIVHLLKKLDQLRQYLKRNFNSDFVVVRKFYRDVKINGIKRIWCKGQNNIYHLYRLKKSEIGLIAILLIILCIALCIIVTGKVTVYYMPVILFPQNSIWTYVVCLLLFIIGLLPVWCKLLAKYKLNKNFCGNEDSMALIEYKNFCFRYALAQQETLHNINMKIDKGEMVLVTGASGCGKTTLLSMIKKV